jgi:hypothetical protein
MLLVVFVEHGQRVRIFGLWEETFQLISVAVWTLGPNWPNNGEIDILEGVNQLTYNAATLHSYVNHLEP